MMRAILLLAILPSLTLAAPQDSVVRLMSHGGSGTVIYTTQGKSLILSSHHMFNGQSRNKPVVVHAPHPQPGANQPAQGRCIAVDPSADLALVELNAGPLPYVCPVAPQGHAPGRLLSCGYDNLKWPSQKRTATLLGGSGQSFTYLHSVSEVDGDRVGEPDFYSCGRMMNEEDANNFSLTRELPWHGRSGGGLLDVDAGYLVGVVSGYRGTSPKTWSETKPGAAGVYTSHAAVRRFVGRHASYALANGYPPPQQQQVLPYQQYGVPAPQYAPQQQQPMIQQQQPYQPQLQQQQGRPWVAEGRERIQQPHQFYPPLTPGMPWVSEGRESPQSQRGFIRRPAQPQPQPGGT